MDVRVWHEFLEPDRWEVSRIVFNVVRRISGGVYQKVTSQGVGGFTYDDSKVHVTIEYLFKSYDRYTYRIVTDGFDEHMTIKFLYLLEASDCELFKWSGRDKDDWFTDTSPATMSVALNVREDKFVEYWLDEIEPLL